jgi:hypothetical protein
MSEPLVDEQDFPLSGIDVYAVTAARGKIRRKFSVAGHSTTKP